MNTASPIVSVLLPVRNGAKTINRAIDSIIKQSLHDWELIVVDDGSEDATPALLQDYSDTRVRVLSQPPLGIVAALNRAAAAASAPYLARMDADDWSAPGRLEKQLRYLNERSNRALVSCLVAHEGAHDQEGYRHHVDRINTLLSHEQMAARRFEDAPVAHPSVMMRKSVFDAVGGYREGDFPEDFELWLRMLDAGYRFAKLPEVLLHWYDHDSRLSRSDARYSQEAFFHQKALYFKRWHARNAPGTPLWICGSGRLVNQRIRLLEEAGLPIAGQVDVKKPDAGDPRNIIAYEALQPAAHPLLLSLIGDRKGKQRLEAFARQRGYVEGKDFWFL